MCGATAGRDPAARRHYPGTLPCLQRLARTRPSHREGCVTGGSAAAGSAEAVDWIARRGHEPAYGARPLRRTIQREVDNRLSRLLLDADISSGDRARVEVADGHLVFHTTGTASNAKQP